MTFRGMNGGFYMRGHCGNVKLVVYNKRKRDYAEFCIGLETSQRV